MSISGSLDTIIDINDDSEIADNIFHMRDAAHKRALLLYRMVREKDLFTREDYRILFYEQAEIFIKSRLQLDQKLLTPEMKKLLQAALVSASKGQKVQSKTVDFIFSDQFNSAEDLLNNQVIPVQDQFIFKFTALLNEVQKKVSDDIFILKQKSENAILTITLLGFMAMLLGNLIAFYVYNRITKSENGFIKQKELAEQSNQAKTMFLANMSHEIRSPLTAIIGFSESLNNRTMNEQAKTSAAQSIERNSKHLYQVINDILDITKIESGQLTVESISTSPIRLCQEVGSIYQSLVQEKGLTFDINYKLPIPQNIFTDPVRLKQVLINLMSNALKFTQHGSINLSARYNPLNESMCFEVTDTGIGMDKSAREKIFTPFTQADTSITRQFGGTGLGLSISQQLAEKLDGTLKCTSQPGIGSHFSLTIFCGSTNDTPMITANDQISHLHESSQNNNPTRLQGSVLVVEDTIDNQKLIELYLTDVGATVTIVENGALAVEICKKEKFDLIFMDMQMPVMDGVTAIGNIRKFDEKTPIISLTANAMKSDADKCTSAGANDFLSKPIDTNKFSHILQQYLNTNIEHDVKKKKSKGLERIIKRFVETLPTRAELIITAEDDSNWDGLQVEAHKLKGLGTSMGYPKLTEICEALCNACVNEEHDSIATMVEEFKIEIKRIIDTL